MSEDPGDLNALKSLLGRPEELKTYLETHDCHSVINQPMKVRLGARVIANYLLNIAANSAPIESVALLVKHGADPRLLDTLQQRSAFCFAMRKAREDVALMLLEHPAMTNILGVAMGPKQETPLMIAVRKGSYTVVEKILEKDHGSSVNVTAGRNALPLYMAVGANDSAMVKLLLPYADIDALFNGVTALRRAVYNASAPELAEQAGVIIRLLLEKGADPTKCGTCIGATTPMHAAIGTKNHAVIELLKPHLGRGSINATDNVGRSLLYKAVEVGNISLAQYLVKNGANVNCVEALGRNILFAAVESGNADIVAWAITQVGFPGKPNERGAKDTIDDLNDSIEKAVGRAQERGDEDEIERFEQVQRFVNGIKRIYDHANAVQEETEEVVMCREICRYGILPRHAHRLDRYDIATTQEGSISHSLAVLKDMLGQERNKILRRQHYQNEVGPLAGTCRTMAFLLGGGYMDSVDKWDVDESGVLALPFIVNNIAGYLGGEEEAKAMEVKASQKADKVAKQIMQRSAWVDYMNYMNFDITAAECEGIANGDTSWLSR